MADYLKLFETAGGALGVQDEIALLKALGEMAGQWRELATRLGTPGDAAALLAKISQDIDGTEVREAFETAGLTGPYETFRRLVGAGKGALDAIPAKYWTLLKPMSDFAAAGAAKDAGLVEWRLLGGEKSLDKGKYKLAAEGSSKLVLDAAAKPTIAGTALAAPHLRLGLEARVGASASGSAPLKWVTIGGEIESSVDLGLDYYFDPDPGTDPYALAVARQLPSLPHPFDFEAMWSAFTEGSRLRNLVFTVKTSAKAAVSVKMAEAGSFAEGIAAEVGAEIAARASQKQEFQLTFSAVEGGGGFAVHMVRGRQTEAGLTLGISASVDLSVKMAEVQKVLEDAVARSDELLGRLTPYLSPGTLLQNRLGGLVSAQAERLISDPGLRAAVGADLRRAAGIADPGEGDLAAHLTDRLIQALNKGADGILDQTTAARESALALLVSSLGGLGGVSADTLRATLAGPLDELTGKAREEIIAGVKGLFEENGERFREALAKAGAASAGAVATADDALKPVRDFLKTYNELLAKARKLAGDAARYKASIKVQIDALWRWGLSDRIVGTFRAKSAAAAAVYDSLARGDLEAVRSLVLDGSPTADFVLDGKSRITRSAGFEQTESVALVLFGFESSATAILKSDATVMLDAEGNLQLDSAASLTKRFKKGDKEREVAFFNTSAIAAIRGSAGSPSSRKIDVGLKIAYKDETLKLGELRAFLGSLVDAGFAPAEVAERARSVFRDWAGSDDEEARLALNLAVKLWLGRDQVERLIRWSEGGAAGLGQPQAEQILLVARAALDRADQRGRRHLDSNLEKVRDRYTEETRRIPYATMVLSLVRSNWEPDRSIGTKQEDSAVFAETRKMKGLLAMIEALRKIYGAAPAVPGDPASAGWKPERYRQVAGEAAAGVRSWLATNGSIIITRPEVAPATVGFLGTLADLASVDRMGALTIEMSRIAEAGEEDAPGTTLQDPVTLA